MASELKIARFKSEQLYQPYETQLIAEHRKAIAHDIATTGRSTNIVETMGKRYNQIPAR